MPSLARMTLEELAARRRASRRRGTNVGLADRVGSAAAGVAIALYGLRRGRVRGAVLGLAGGALLTRGLTGRSRVYDSLGIATGGPTRVHRAITINRSPDDVYRAWRDPASCARVMERLDPGSTSMEIATDVPNEMVEWRSGSAGGAVRFQRAPGERGTEVRLTLERARAADVEDALLRLKALVEAGETPTTAGQPSGRRS